MTAALDLQSRQLMQRLGLEGGTVDEEQYVQVSTGAMSAVSVVGVRRKDDDPFTGWDIIAASEDPRAAQFTYYTVSELAAERPAWTIALPLPIDWAFRFVDKTLVDCVSPDGVTHVVNIEVNMP